MCFQDDQMDAQEADGPADLVLYDPRTWLCRYAFFLFPRRSRFMLPLRFGPTSRVASQTSSCFSSSWIQTQTSGCNDFVTGRASLRWKFWKGLYRLEMPPSMPSCLVSFQPRTDLAMSPYRSMWTMQRCWAEKKLVNISTSQLDFKKFLSLTCQH